MRTSRTNEDVWISEYRARVSCGKGVVGVNKKKNFES